MPRPNNADDVLAHYGIPGMKWGKRKSSSVSASKKAASKKNDVKKLSDADLKAKLNRLQMEQQYTKLTSSNTAVSKGQTFVQGIAVNVARQTITNLASRALSVGVEAAINSVLKK